MKKKLTDLANYSILMNDFYNHVLCNNELRTIVNKILSLKRYERI